MASANNGAGFTIREMRPEDVQDAGDVLYRAFYVDSLATGVPTSFNVASPEVASRMLGSFVSQPSCYKLVAIDSEGKVVGGVLIQHGSGDNSAHGVGPVFVSLDAADRGIGKTVTKAVVEHAQSLNAPSIRLNTSASNRKSFCLYASLGFMPVECTTSFFGTVNPDDGVIAASALEISTEVVRTRKMEAADIKACGDMYSKAMGYDREDEIRDMHSKFSEKCWVATTKDNSTILGYTTGLFLLGHTMGSSEAAWVAVITRAIRENNGNVSSLTIPGAYYPRLIKWALATKLILTRHNWYMVIGMYQKPNDGFFWSPSITH
ncbi:uncharacterized protein [Physcomitrium patens]|uniref:N-acetyltransferase domain-containing protein n=1 Tax=Physcomitrium patens TaxID=3218 RepID=A0A2K1JT89_PHYPA|nr:uncharacterized protein LOC112288938 [Physcomitrium patens]PNR44754.1 hypothetical protein PHYPA_014524 [Physcomitrium patens]|eukprot:XP_024389470.1 uncharacterized protein LOC112288938 [Physcomitrella patens]